MCHIQLRYDEKQHNKKWQDLTWQVRMKCYSGKHQFSAIWYVMFFKKDTLTVWFSYNNHCSWHTELLSFQCFTFSDTPMVIIFRYPVERCIFGSINTDVLMKINHQCEFKTKMFTVINWNWENSFNKINCWTVEISTYFILKLIRKVLSALTKPFLDHSISCPCFTEIVSFMTLRM